MNAGVAPLSGFFSVCIVEKAEEDAVDALLCGFPSFDFDYPPVYVKLNGNMINL